MKQKNKELNKKRDVIELASLVAHQLKTPLTAIKWYSDLLLTRELGVLNAKQRRYIEVISNANGQALSLIGELLDVSKVEFGKFYIEPRQVDIRQTVHDILENFSKPVHEKKIKLETKIDNKVNTATVDPKVVTTVLQNLIDNAVKYTPNGGHIYISLKFSGKNLLVNVGDTGCGISKEAQKHIFSRFFRDENARKLVSAGTGLGLYVVKKILDQIGGNIWFESEENKGTNFHVSIPIESPR